MDKVPPGLHWLLFANPFTPLAEGYHSILLQGEFPSLPSITIALVWLLCSLMLARLLLSRSREFVVDWL
jgi:ABC-type polysaccharide/polyol phosphate export permease